MLLIYLIDKLYFKYDFYFSIFIFIYNTQNIKLFEIYCIYILLLPNDYFFEKCIFLLYLPLNYHLDFYKRFLYMSIFENDEKREKSQR